jgi:hypothetical protein
VNHDILIFVETQFKENTEKTAEDVVSILQRGIRADVEELALVRRSLSRKSKFSSIPLVQASLLSAAGLDFLLPLDLGDNAFGNTTLSRV